MVQCVSDGCSNVAKRRCACVNKDCSYSHAHFPHRPSAGCLIRNRLLCKYGREPKKCTRHCIANPYNALLDQLQHVFLCRSDQIKHRYRRCAGIVSHRKFVVLSGLLGEEKRHIETLPTAHCRPQLCREISMLAYAHIPCRMCRVDHFRGLGVDTPCVRIT